MGCHWPLSEGVDDDAALVVVVVLVVDNDSEVCVEVVKVVHAALDERATAAVQVGTATLADDVKDV